MNRLIIEIKNRAGFVSIETIIIAGLMIGLGMSGILNLYEAGAMTIDDAVSNYQLVLTSVI